VHYTKDGNFIANIWLCFRPKDFKVPDGDNPDWWDRIFQDGIGMTKDGKWSDEMLLVKPGGNITFVKPNGSDEDLRDVLLEGWAVRGSSASPVHEDPFVLLALGYVAGLRALAGGAARTAAGKGAAAAKENVIRGLYGTTTRQTLNKLASSEGPTLNVFTRLSQAPQAGRGLSVSVGDPALSQALPNPEATQMYAGNIPRALIEEMRAAGLLIQA
jgi:hypothetical protein